MGLRLRKGVLIGGSHALGHADIDADHFAIADCWSAAMRCNPLTLEFQVARLRKLMRRHFDNEAALVEASGNQFCWCHRREHETMLSLCDEIYALADRNWRMARGLLRDKLPRLVRDHIITMDQIAVLMINTATDGSSALRPCR